MAKGTGQTVEGRQKFRLNLLVKGKPVTELGDVTSDIVLNEEDLVEIEEMNKKGLKGHKAQTESK